MKTSMIVIIVLVLIIIGLTGFMTLSKESDDSSSEKTQETSQIKGEEKDSAEGKVELEAEEIPSTKNTCTTPFIMNDEKNGCCLDIDSDNRCDSAETMTGKGQSMQENAGSDETSGQNNDAEYDSEAAGEEATMGEPDTFVAEDGCGDGHCEASEMDSCCFDCGCEAGEHCSLDNECLPTPSDDEIDLDVLYGLDPSMTLKLPKNSICGDGYCNDQGVQEGPEDRSSCCEDCGCLMGSCINNTCVNRFKLKQDFRFQGPKEDPLNSLSSTDYLLVTIDKITPTKIKFDGDRCTLLGPCLPDYYSEFEIFSMTKKGDDFQKVVYPLGRPSKTFLSENIRPSINTDPIPVFAMEKDYLDNDNIYFQTTVAEIDKNLVVPKMNFDNMPGEMYNLLLKGNDDQGTLYEALKASNDYGLGVHTKYFPYLQMDYSVREVKNYDGIRLKAKIKDFIFDEDSEDSRAEVVVWYRVADNIVADEYGIGTEYEGNQKAGGFFLENYDDIQSSDFPVTVRVNKEIYSTDNLGPFLYLEVEFVDLDSDCKSLPESPYPCVDTNKVDVLYSGNLFLTADDAWLLSYPNETLTKEFTLPVNGLGLNEATVELTREPLV